MQNYHKHTFFSNVLVTDCTASPSDYVKRALELGHQVISTVEHGFQSNYYDYYDLVTDHNAEVQGQFERGEISEEEKQKKTLKFVIGAEAYWVKDRKREYEKAITTKNGEEKQTIMTKNGKEVRFQKDGTNCHIVILAKNEEGRRELNGILSEANLTGFYRQPRVDLDLLLSLTPENVMITSACVKYWAYSDIDEITLRLFEHFGQNFFLEVQCHNTEKQKNINAHILELHYKYGIPIICGLDSHYIYPEDDELRKNFLDGRGITYDEDETGWYMDYPDDEEVIRRFKEQGVLNDAEIVECMANTDVILTFDDISFDKEIKLPSIYPDKTQEEKDRILSDLVWGAWEQEKKHVSPEKYPEYEDGIRYELSAVTNTHMSDYFLIDHAIVKRGVERGGVITKTGRGSGVSYYINSLLGFSNIDRFASPVKLYPDRFISETRILKTRSLPDLDLNLANPEVFAQAQDEVLTEAYGTDGHSYPMISYKPLQASSAFKLLAKAKNLDFETANRVTDCIAKYEKALKHANSPEEREEISIYDFIPDKYHKLYDESKKYQGIINTKSQAPCGYLIYQGDIRREIGLIRCTSSTGSSVLTTVIDGAVAEKYKFVKNDLLKVDIWMTINEIFERVGIPTPTVTEMSQLVENDDATWDMYAKGYLCGVNQCESDFGRRCCMIYKPRNIQEMTALVAALRPGFKTQLDNFLNRKPYSTGNKILDSLLTDSYHYIMYQENIMTYLGWLSIEQTETYDIIKKISKKKFKEKELAELKSRLVKEWIKKTGSGDGFEDTWDIVEAFSKYAFNASHSISYAYDSVYGAYAKAHYPYEFYSVMLQTYADKGDKDKVAMFRDEMKTAFGIEQGEYKFRLDNRRYTADKEHNRINPSLSSLKGIGGSVAQELYEIRNAPCKTFTDLLLYIKEYTTLGRGVIESLIKINYFSEFGNIHKLLRVIKCFDYLYDKSKKRFKKNIPKASIKTSGLTEELVSAFAMKQTEKTYGMVDSLSMLHELESLEYKELPSNILASFQMQVIKDVLFTDRNASGVCVIRDVDTKGTPRLNGYSLKNGGYFPFKISKKDFAKRELNSGDVIQITHGMYKPKQKHVDGKWVNDTTEKELWVVDFHVLWKGDKVWMLS